VEGSGGLAVRLSLYGAALAVGASFGLLFEPGDAVTVRMLGAVLAGALAGSAGRYRFALLVPAAAVYGLLGAYGPAALNPFGFSGGSGLIAELRHDTFEALATMYAQPIPYEAQPGLVLLLAPVVVMLTGLSVSATLYEESPVFTIAILGVTLGVISTVSFEAGVGPYFAVFLAASVALLLLTTGPGRLGLRGAVAGAGVVCAAILLPQSPLSEVAIRPAAIDWTEVGAGDTSRLATEADVGPYLDSGRDAELLRVRSEEPLYWRGGTLDSFNGARWSSTLEEGDPDGEEIAPGVETETVRQSVEVLEAETGLVFGGYNIQDVTLSDAEPAADGSWTATGRLEQGERYGVISEVPQPTGSQLAGAGTDYSPEMRERFLQMPGDLPQEVSATAETIRRDYSPRNPYETARAIQRYLLYDGGFTYNLEVDYRRADRALEEFLGDEREGFCTQFATSMALVAREMGVPTRVVYGATTGEEVDDGEYVVRGANMHTWVEVYFPGVGWYPFDPTPGLGVTGTMEENAPAPEPGGDSASQSQSPAALGGASANSSPWVEGGEAPQPGDSGESSAARQNTEPAGPLFYALAAALVAAAVLSVPLAKRLLLERGSPEGYYRDIVGRLEDSMPGRPPGPASRDSLTPAERLSTLAREARLEEGPFLSLAWSYTEHLYSPNPAADPAADHAAALRSYNELPRWRRVLGAVNPTSLARRLGAAFPSRAWRERLRRPWRPRPR